MTRQPPADETAERSLLGACLLDRRTFEEVVSGITPDDFYVDRHRHVWQAMQRLRDEGLPVDPVMLLKVLRDTGRLDAVGGASYLGELARSVPTAANAAHYAQIVRDCSFRRRLIAAGTRIAALAWADEDVTELANQAERVVREATSGAFVEDRFVSIGSAMVQRWEHLYETRHRADVLGLPTGYRALDGMLAGLMPADLIILAARPSMGKTALALGITLNVARRGHAVAFFSLEMSRAQIADRVVCATVPLDSRRVRARRLTDAEWERAVEVVTRLGSLPIYIDDQPAQTTSEVWAKARRVDGLGLVVIDYLHLLGDRRHPGASRSEQLEEMVGRLKAMARDLDVPVLCLSQLSRAPEGRPDKRPQLADLRDSGGIEQTADVVLLLHRPSFYDPGERPGIAELEVAKQRNGPRGTIELAFDEAHARFGDLERRREEPTCRTGLSVSA